MAAIGDATNIRRWAPPWWAVFLVGLVLWVATIGAAGLTGNLIILPTIVLLGSFLVLGATVGFGFAALESSGYALASLFVVYQHRLYLSLDSVVYTELIRGVLAPFGHGAWSAIVGGAIFAAARRHGRIRLSGSVVGA